MTGTVFDIKKFSVNDGPGIRTTVFLKGCPLKCLWCHNPESQNPEKELFFAENKCIKCNWCISMCSNGLERKKCISCGKCTEQCYSGARKIIGRSETADDVITEVMKDAVFYERSDGGITISGGEPLFQPEFCFELLQKSKIAGLHTCLDTSGFAPRKIMKQILPFVDLFLYDLKETDYANHLACTGVPLDIILENLKLIDENGKKIILRCPIVPGINMRSEHAEKIAEIAKNLSNLLEINLMPYHPLGESKLVNLGKIPVFTSDFADKNIVEKLRQQIADLVNVPVKIS